MTRFVFILALLVVQTVIAAPVTLERIQALTEREQSAWKLYLQRSQTNALADLAAVQAEVIANKLTNALPVPSGGDFKLPAKMDDAWYSRGQAKVLSDAVLSFQTPSGGWSKHTGYSKGPRRAGMWWSSQNEPGQKSHYVATFDNRSTTEEMRFLAAIWYATKREDCATAFTKGLNFILSAQYPNGGWPQVYPLEGSYHDNITFNDDAMTRVLELLWSIKQNERYYSFLTDADRRRVDAAFASGIRCLLGTQVVQTGKTTGWCAQYDPLTLQPAAARAMEPSALSGLESARIVEFLMTITNPAPEVVVSIEGGLHWLERAKIIGLGKAKANGKTSYEPDSSSSEVYWARFYDLTNGRPIFPGRDGVVYASYAEMAAGNRLGYDYLSTLPGSVVKNGQKKWRKMLEGPAIK